MKGDVSKIKLEEKNKKEEENETEEKYKIKIIFAFGLILFFIIIGLQLILIYDETISGNLESEQNNNIESSIKDEEENLELETQNYNKTDIIPGKNIIFEGEEYAIQAEEVEKMISGTYEGNEKYVFLTFDDGPSPLTNEVLDILKEEGVKGTFFMLGNMIESGQEAKDTLKRAIKEGNAIANHSYSHDFKKLYPGNITDIEYFMYEFNKTNSIMKEVLGDEFNTRVLRMPGGYNSRVYYNDKNLKELNSVLKEKGIVSVDWNSLNGDAEGKNYTKEEMIDYVKKTSDGKNQIVLLMHDTYGKEKTVSMLKDVIKFYKENGYEFKTIKDSDF